MRVVFVTLVGLSSVICTGRAHAEAPRRVAKLTTPHLGTSKATKDHHEALVAQADADADARVTARELEAFVVRYVRKQVASRFERLDRNRDGVVAKSEVPKMDGARFARFDADSDERLVASELESTLVPLALSRCRAAFARLDLDRDGAITLNEREPSDGRQASR